MRFARLRLVLAIPVLLVACQRRYAVWIDELTSRTGVPVFGVGARPDDHAGIEVGTFVVFRCAEYDAASRKPGLLASERLMTAPWAIVATSGAVVRTSVPYGATLPGFRTIAGPGVLAPGCYVAGSYGAEAGGSAAVRFQVDGNGRAVAVQQAAL